jgi:predicted nuclease of predicted toxin-antitoxin system
VKLLFDENLSRKLVVPLAESYPGSAHVETFDLLARSDRDIWEFAAGGFHRRNR